MPQPKSLADPANVSERLLLLESEPSAQPLHEWAAELAIGRKAVVPFFDPAEGGVNAKILLIHEAPGPMTKADNARPGSGFISVDNNDQTAAMVWATRNEMGLHTGMLG